MWRQETPGIRPTTSWEPEEPCRPFLSIPPHWPDSANTMDWIYLSGGSLLVMCSAIITLTASSFVVLFVETWVRPSDKEGEVCRISFSAHQKEKAHGIAASAIRS